MPVLWEYATWFDWRLFAYARVADSISTPTLICTMILSIGVYSGAILEKLRTASTADARRRLSVLSLGSVLGLGSNLAIWAILPRFGYNPTQIRWLGYISSVLLLIFPLTLAYVVVVQRALDVRLLLRIGTKYILARTSLLILQFSVLAVILFRFLIPLLEEHRGRRLTVIVIAMFAGMMFRIYFVKRSIWNRLREMIDKRFFREAYNAEIVLSELAESVRGILEPQALLQAVSTRVSEVLHVQRMAVLIRHGGTFRVQAIMGTNSGGIGLSESPVLVLEERSTPVRHLVSKNVPAVLYRDRPEDWYIEASPMERMALDALNAEVLLPLAGRNKLMGVMVLGPKLSEEAYSQTDLRLLASVGAQVGLGLEINDLAQSLAHEAARGERMAREVEIAREVQERLFPQNIPFVHGLDLAGHCRPALAVGGDYYDMIELGDGRLALAIGDVSGKGIGAALLMASLRASLRGMTDSGSHDLARMIRKLNRLVYESSTSNRYATFFFGIYDPAARELRYVNGGHNAPMVIREGEVVRLEATGPVVGLLKDVEFEEQVLPMGPGDLFIGYTDGISEAMTVDDEEWGDERMLEMAQTVRARSSKDIIQALFRGADAFAAGAPQYDDMTLLIFKCV
jgi:sigma-B regulation protein RsbU (phosphoserine phosphatase)